MRAASAVVVALALLLLAAASASATSTARAPAAQSSVQCTVCQWVFAEVQTLLTQNSTETELLSALQKGCSLLPSEYAQECSDLVTNFGPEILQYLDTMIDPKALCSFLGMCVNSTTAAAAQREVARLRGVHVMQLKSKHTLVGSVVCPVCEWVVRELENWITSNSTEQEIVHAVESVCKFVPKSLEAICDAYIEQYGPKLIEAGVAKETPQVVCDQVHACSSAAPRRLAKPVVAPVAVEEPETAVNGALPCAACKFVIAELRKWLSSSSTDAEIVEVVENVCKLVPSGLRTVCDSFIEQYGPIVLQKLLERVEPSTLCEAVGLCSAGTVFGNTKGSNNGLECTICEWVLGEIEGLITSNSTEAQIVAAVEKVCNIVPKAFQPTCQAFISQYGPEVIQALVNHESPQTVCTQIGLCSSAAVKAPAPKAPAPKPVTAGGLECTICEWVLGEIEGLITSNSTEAQIVAAVEKVCNIVPKAFQPTCQAFISQYGPEVIQALVNHESPQTVCTQIGLCSSASLVAAVEVRVVETAAPVTGGLECTICEWVLGEIEGLITNNSTEAQIIAAVEKVCNIVPKSFQSTCQEFIAEYGPEVIQLLVNRESPQTVCTQIGLCSSKEVAAAAAATVAPVTAGGLECTICEWVLGEIEGLITSNSTEAQIVAAVEKVCNIVPKAFQPTCQAFISQYGPEVIQALVNHESPQTVCTQIGLCSSAAVKAPAPKAPAPKPVTAGGLECTICEWVLGEIEGLITSNSTEAQIVAAVEKVCNIVPKAFQPTCQAFISQYGPEVIQALVNRESPQTVCTQIGLCSSASLVAAVEVRVVETAAPVTGGLECTICEWVLGEIEGLITNNSTEAQIIAAVEKVCNIVPKSFQSTCQAFIAEYGPEVIQLLVNRESPQTVCTQIGLCASKEVAAAAAATVAPVTAGGLECTICEWVLGEIEGLITSNSTEAQIVAAVEKVCNIVPKAFQPTCQAFISQYGPEVIQALVNHESPQTVCTQIGLCSSAAVKAPARKPVTAGGLECTICEWVLGEIEGLITNNSTEAQIIAAVEKVCNIVPKAFQPTCQAFISQYGPEVIQALVNHESPQTVCTQIGLCSSAASFVAAVEVHVVKAPAPKPVTAGGLECTICEWVLGEIEGLITSNSTEAQIVAAVEKVCNIVPKAFQPTCQAFISQYGPEVIQALVNHESPQTVCTQIGLCSSTVLRVAPVAIAAPVSGDAFVPNKCVDTSASVNGMECALCQWVLSTVEQLLSSNSSEAAIVAALDKVCSVVPGAMQSACDDFVAAYTPELIQLLLQKATPSAICSKLGLCSSVETAPAPQKPVKSLKGAIECTACEWLMSTVENYVTENTTETEIVEFLGRVCHLVPGALGQQCVNLLDEYGPALIEQLVSKASPATICGKLGLCPTTAMPVVPQPKPVPVTAVNTASEMCSLCQWLIGEVEQYIGQPDQEEKIAEKLASLCKSLPGEIGTVCESLIDSVGADVIAVLLSKETPDKVCHLLRVCPTARPALFVQAHYVVGMTSLNVTKNPDELQREKDELEASLRGASIDIMFMMPSGDMTRHTFGKGQSVDQLKDFVVRKFDLDYNDVQLYLNQEIMPDPLSLNDFPALKDAAAAMIKVTVESSE